METARKSSVLNVETRSSPKLKLTDRSASFAEKPTGNSASTASLRQDDSFGSESSVWSTRSSKDSSGANLLTVEGESGSIAVTGSGSTSYQNKDVLTKEQLKIKRRNAILGQIINVDMSESMRELAIELGIKSMSKFGEKEEPEKEVAQVIKREFDERYLPNWHCIVGKQFGAYVTHDCGCFVYFYLGSTAIMLFQAG